MFKQRTFKFSPEISILAVLAAITCGYLSHWQYTRYVEKKAYFAQVARQETRGPVPFDPATRDWAGEYHAKVTTTGRWDHAHAMLLINRSLGSVPGFKLVEPLLVADGKGGETAVLVDRGFLPMEDVDGGWLTKQPEHQIAQVEGFLRPSQHTSFSLAPPESKAKPGEFKQRWMRLTVESMAEQLPWPLPPVFIEQTNTGTAYPVYNEREIIGPARHLNYCMQWASFGLFGLFVALMTQLKKPKAVAAA